MITLKAYQEKAVTKLLDASCAALSYNETKRKIPILLKAPTGAGKTVIMASFISQLISEVKMRPNIATDLAFIWLAPNTLHLQSYDSLKGFYSEMHDLKTKKIEDLGGNDFLHTNDLLFINWSSVDKDKNTFRKENERNFNIQSLIENTYSKGTELVVIIDEAHLSAFTGKQAIEVLKLIDAKIEISVTATPNHLPDYNVIIQRQSVVEEQMIKKGVKLNIDLSEEEQKGTSIDLHLLRKAIEKRNELEKAYREAGININPLLLIQLPSEKAVLTDEDNSKRLIMENYLDGSEFGITTANGQLAIWLSDTKDKLNLEGLELPLAQQKVLIFKQAISQGWDCPRAAVLLIFREIGNATFGIQTVGRILRMPEQKHYTREVLNHGYVYTNIQNEVIQLIADDLDYFSLNIARRKENLRYDSLRSSLIVNDRPTPGYLKMDFEGIFHQLIEQKYSITQIPEKHLFTKEEASEIEKHIQKNRAIFKSNFWELDVEEIEIAIPKDITIDNYELNSYVDAHDTMGHFAKTQPELRELLLRYCYNSITRLNRAKSYKYLHQVLIQFVEYYMSIDEYTARKILLYRPNNILLTELIVYALERYDVWLKEQGNKNRRVIKDSWQVPEERHYSDVFTKKAGIKAHALEPFYEYNNVSKPEILFKELLENNIEYIEWWYKNGDKGKEHFSIHYKNMAGEDSLFYVDFIVRFRSGKIGLFDTKTKKSDYEASNKHNALISYMEEESKKKGVEYLGGVIIGETIDKNTYFRFCENRIENTSDLRGWTIFNPQNY